MRISKRSYTYTPVYNIVLAIKYDGDLASAERIENLIKTEIGDSKCCSYTLDYPGNDCHLYIDLENDSQDVNAGDYVVILRNGSVVVLPEAVFENLFERN